MSSNDFIKRAISAKNRANKIVTNICDEVEVDENIEQEKKDVNIQTSNITANNTVYFTTEAINPEMDAAPVYNYAQVRATGFGKIKQSKKYADPSAYPSSYHKPEYSQVSEGEFSKEDLELVRSSLQIKEVDSVTMVTCLVLDKEQENGIIALRCLGQPLGGYIYDNAQDAYLVTGCHCFDLGQFSFALKLTVPGSGEWSQNIPIPVSVLENHFSPAQRKMIEENKKKYPSPRYEIKYIQMVS